MNDLAEATEPVADGTGPDLRLLLVRGVVRSLPWVLGLILLGAAAGLAAGLLQPNLYVSNAKLVLRMGAREQLTSESLLAPDEQQHAPPPTLVDELQMLSDPALYERVARTLGPRTVLQPADPAALDGPLTSLPVHLMHRAQGLLFRALSARPATGPAGETAGEPAGEDHELRRATKALRASLPTNEPGSNVLLVSYTATSPYLARTVVQALTDAFIERHREQYSIRSLLEKNRGKLEEAKRARDQAASAYVEQVSQSGISVLATQVPRLETELGLLEAQVFATRVDREENSRLRGSLANRLAGIPEVVELLRPAVMIPNEDYETQLTLMRMLLGQKQEMLIKERLPTEELRRREQGFDRQIADLSAKLKTLPKTIPQGAEMMQENVGHAAMEARIVDLELEDEALAVKLGLLETRLDAEKQRIGELQKQLLAGTMLERDLASARASEESRYALMLERFSFLEALENLDVDEEANLRVLQAPTLEFEKVAPRRGKLLLAGLLAGVVAGLVLAVVRERCARRLGHPELFREARGVPVLAVVPHLSSLRRLERRAQAAGP